MKVTTAVNSIGQTTLSVELEVGINAWVVIRPNASRLEMACALQSLALAVFANEGGRI